jgi:hypothetical protein
MMYLCAYMHAYADIWTIFKLFKEAGFGYYYYYYYYHYHYYYYHYYYYYYYHYYYVCIHPYSM